MTYGFRPENWPTFQAELQKRGISGADIEKVEMRPTEDRVPSWRNLSTRISEVALNHRVDLRRGPHAAGPVRGAAPPV